MSYIGLTADEWQMWRAEWALDTITDVNDLDQGTLGLLRLSGLLGLLDSPDSDTFDELLEVLGGGINLCSTQHGIHTIT